MVGPIHWETSYRIIPSRFPAVGIFDEVSDPGDLEVVLELEAATNPRVLEETGELPLVREADRISGPGTTPIMASFTHTRPSRFSDGSFGVYYAADHERTAVAESAYHRSVFLKDAGFMSERLDMRVYVAAIFASCDDLRRKSPRSKLYDPNSYAYSQQYATRLYRRNVVDGIVYLSVRDASGTCVAVFRPRCVSDCNVLKHLEYRFENCQLVAVVDIGAGKPTTL